MDVLGKPVIDIF